MKIMTFLLVALAIGFFFQGCASFWEHYNATHPNGNNKYYEMITGLSPREAEYMKFGLYEPKSFEATATGTIGNISYGIRPRWNYPRNSTPSLYPIMVLVYLLPNIRNGSDVWLAGDLS